MKRLAIGLGVSSLLLLVACGDDTPAPQNTAGSAGTPSTAGSGTGGSASGSTAAGSAGMSTAGTATGGTTAGSGGSGGSGGSAGAGGSGGSGGSGGASCDTNLGKAIKFAGSVVDSVAGDLGADATFGDKPRSVELWAKYTSVTSWQGEHTILEIGKPSEPDNGNNVFGIDMTGYDAGTKKGTFGPYTHGVSDNNTGANPLPVLDVMAPEAGWLHLSWAYDPTKNPANTRLEFTVNGNVLPTEWVQSKYDDTDGKLVGNTGFVLLGASQNFGPQGWDGVMDEVRIWSVYRTPQQIKDNMKAIVKPDTAGLVAYYQFNEGDAANVSDSTKNAAHKLAACTQAGGACSSQNAAMPSFVESDVPGPFTCGQ
jgi:hypothetical protein